MDRLRGCQYGGVFKLPELLLAGNLMDGYLTDLAFPSE